MAHFLFASVPLVGHVNPAIPIVRELIERGHEVSWYAGQHFQQTVERTGARFFPRKAARDFDALAIDKVFPEKKHLRGLASLKFDVKHLFLDPIPGHRADLAELLARHPIDVVVTDSAFFGMETLRHAVQCHWAAYGISCLHYHSVDTPPFGPGIRPLHSVLGRTRNRLYNFIAEHLIGRDVMQYYDTIRSSLNLARSAHYLANVIVKEADLYLQPSIAEFEYPRRDLPDTVHFVGAFLPNPAEPFTPPAWWGELKADRPVVHVTQGTLSTDYRDLLIPAVQALAKEDCLVVATTGGKPIESIGIAALPDNVRMAPYIPHHHLLPFVDVMVTNGGYGGVQQALAYGIPLVAAGNTEEKPEICARIRWSGAGIDLKSQRPSPGKIRDAVHKVLQSPDFKTQAERLKREYQRYDPPRLAADLLERLAAQRRSALREHLMADCA